MGTAAAKNGSHCRMARLALGPARGYALFEQGQLSALFFTAGVKTDRGIGIGSTSKALEKAYGSSRLLFAPAGDSLGIHVYTRKRYLRDAPRSASTSILLTTIG